VVGGRLGDDLCEVVGGEEVGEGVGVGVGGDEFADGLVVDVLEEAVGDLVALGPVLDVPDRLRACPVGL
jgi:hypothetical protein